MFKNTKFKKGDRVALLSDLQTCREVVNVFLEDGGNHYFRYFIERVTLDNDHTYSIHELTFFSEPIAILKKTISESSSKNGQEFATLKKENVDLKKQIKDLKEEVFGKENIRSVWDNFSFSRMFFGETEEKETKLSIAEKLNKIEEYLKIKYDVQESKKEGYKPIKKEKKLSKKTKK